MLIGTASLKPQVGKTAVADILKKDFGFLHAEMSDPIAILAEKFFGYNGDKSDPNQRRILQEIGIMGKKIDPTIWFYATLSLARRRKWGLSSDLVSPTFLFYYNVKGTREEILKNGFNNYFKGSDVVIGGIRSPDEADEILKLEGKVYRIDRNNDADAMSHPVENALSGYNRFSGIIKNDGTLEDLEQAIKFLVERNRSGNFH
jgi:hypothetical protein